MPENDRLGGGHERPRLIWATAYRSGKAECLVLDKPPEDDRRRFWRELITAVFWPAFVR